MSWPTPTRADHDKFCRTEDWTVVRRADGSKVAHHITYELALADGRILRTRISRPPNRDTYGDSIWAHILRDQLDVTAAEFWGCVHDGLLPNRGAPEIPQQAIPAAIVFALVRDAHIPEAEVAKMTRMEAIARANEFWTTGH